MMDAQSGKMDRDEIYSNVVRAGKRTYFFDVKATRGDDLYLTITESKKKFKDDGTSFYEKHKVFLYKEDFEKFSNGLKDVLNKIEELKSSNERFKNVESNHSKPKEEPAKSESEDEFTDITFEDLGSE